jgi:hypothetical protein
MANDAWRIELVRPGLAAGTDVAFNGLLPWHSP